MEAGITFPSTVKFTPVSINELQEYCWENLKALDLLSKSAEGVKENDLLLSEGTTWEGTKDQIAVLEQTTLWKVLCNLHIFAESGLSCDLAEAQLDDFLNELVQWLGASFAYREFQGLGMWAGEKVISKFLARMKLNHKWDLADKFVAVESGWYPDTHPNHLTIKEVALLAGVDNIRSVRNATYDKKALPLETFKEGRAVLVTVENARKWLQGRKGFVPTVGVDYGNSK